MLQYPNQSLASLPQNHDVRHLVRQIYMLADEALERDRTSLILSQKIVQFLYKTSSPLGREVYVAILDQLCRTFEEVAKEAIAWLLYAEDEVSSITFHAHFRALTMSRLAQVQCSSYRYTFKERAHQSKSARQATS